MKYAKRVGLVVAAVMALAALTGVASASAAEFHATVVGARLTGNQTAQHVFTIQGEKFTCEIATFSGKTEALNSTEQKMAPTYSGCTAFGFETWTVNTSGCVYTFHSSGTMDLGSCTAGHVTLTMSIPFIAKCVVIVPNQAGINGQVYGNGGGSLNVMTNSTNIKSEVVTSTGACPLRVGSTTSTYTGETKVSPNEGSISFG